MKRDWRGNRICWLRGVAETGDQIFFQCHIARPIWFSFKEALGWDRVPQSMQDVFDFWIPMGGRDYHIKLSTFVIVLWGLWNVRNKIGIEKKFLRSSNEVFHITEMTHSFEGG